MKLSKPVLTLIGLLSVPWCAPAQDSLRTAPEYELDPIVVTATRYARPVLRVPYAIDLLNQDAIQRAEIGLSLEESLRSLPGIIVNNRNNLAQGDRITLRGLGSRAPFGVRGLKIIQDGIPLTMADGVSQLNNVDLASTGHIEVLRGPSSSLYGNAAGGILNLQTQTTATPFLFQPRFLAGSNGFRKWLGKVSVQTGPHQYLINVNTLWQDGYREHGDARSTGINAVGRHALSGQVSLTSVFNYYDAPYLLNPSSLDKETADTKPTSARVFIQQQGSAKQIRQGQGGLTLRYHDAARNQVEVTLYGLGRSLLQTIPGRIIDLDRKGGGIRTVYSRETPVADATMRLTAGADFEIQSDARKEFGNGGIPDDQVGKVNDETIFDLLTFEAQQLNQDEQVFSLGPFVELELAPYPDWIFTVGGRYDRFRFKVEDRFLGDNVNNSGTRTMDQFSPMAGLAYRPHRSLIMYGNFATAFQTPTTNELGNQPTGEGGFNPNLHPERLRGFEAGFKGLWPEYHLTWDTAFYIFRINDMLIPFQIDDPNTEEVFFRNAGKAENKGMEAKLSWAPRPAWQFSLAYMLMAFTFKDFQVEQEVNNTLTLFQLAGNEVPGVPQQHLFAGVTYRHATGAFAETNLQWINQYFANDFNGPAPGSVKPIQDFINDGYMLVDLRLGVQHGFGRLGIEFFIGINNLFDTRYNGSVVPNAAGDRFFEPAAGRTWYIGTGIPLLNTGN